MPKKWKSKWPGGWVSGVRGWDDTDSSLFMMIRNWNLSQWQKEKKYKVKLESHVFHGRVGVGNEYDCGSLSITLFGLLIYSKCHISCTAASSFDAMKHRPAIFHLALHRHCTYHISATPVLTEVCQCHSPSGTTLFHLLRSSPFVDILGSAGHWLHNMVVMTPPKGDMMELRCWISQSTSYGLSPTTALNFFNRILKFEISKGS